MHVEPRTRLPNGAKIADFVNPKTREVGRAVYVDPAVYEAETETIFARSWIFVGHESEIPKSGDYVVRNIGEDSVIVVRTAKGGIHVNLNICPHRGMRICAAERGNTATFTCNYHGWVFRHDGRFTGTPAPQEQMHGDVLKKSDLGLCKARVELYGGLIFANWDSAAPSFDTFLGDFKFYSDVLFNRTDGGMEVLGPPQRCIIDCNWKVVSEQFACDAYHTLSAHRSLLEMGFRGEGNHIERALPGLYSVQVGANGHSARCINPYTYFLSAGGEGDADPLVQLTALPPPGMTAELVPEMFRRLTAEQTRLLATRPPSTGSLFPNFGFLVLYLQRPGGKLVPMMNVKTWIPRGPGKVEFVNFFLAEKGAPQELKDEMLSSAVNLTGVSGMVEQDDGEVWSEIQRGFLGPMGRRQTAKYQAVLGEKKPADWPGGGHVYAGFNKDDSQWNWWLRWAELMGGNR